MSSKKPPDERDTRLVALLQELASGLTTARSLGDLFHDSFDILSRSFPCDVAAAAVLEQNLHLFISRQQGIDIDEMWFHEAVRTAMRSELPFAPNEAILASEKEGLSGEGSGARPEHSISSALMIDNQIVGVCVLARGGAPFDEFEQLLMQLAAPVISMSVVALRARDQVQQMADTDDLTGSWNKRSFRRTLQAEVDRSRVYKVPLSLLMLDVDDFKSINDRYGHIMGDVLLSELCGAVRESLRPTDFFARFGGDEFAIIMPHTGAEGALSAAERIFERTSKVSVPADDGHTIHATFSIGVATYGSDSDAQSLLKEADEKLYEAKREGKSRIAE